MIAKTGKFADINKEFRSNFTRDAGFTLVELLVAIGIISFLVLLIIPAVLKTRAAARSTQCKNNLMNIGLGLAQFETSNGRFPGVFQGYVPDGVGPKKYVDHSPAVAISPYIDGMAISTAADKMMGDRRVNGKDTPNLPAPRIFHCPEDSIFTSSSTNYRFCRGVLPLWPSDPLGVFVKSDKGYTSQEITDGLSNTAFCSERLVYLSNHESKNRSRGYAESKDQNPNNIAEWCSDNNIKQNSFIWSNQMSGSDWTSGRWADASYYHLYKPNSRWVDCIENNKIAMAVITARSYHDSGVHLLMGDGSVKFIKDTININIWRGLATRNGSESDQNY